MFLSSSSYLSSHGIAHYIFSPFTLWIQGFHPGSVTWASYILSLSLVSLSSKLDPIKCISSCCYEGDSDSGPSWTHGFDPSSASPGTFLYRKIPKLFLFFFKNKFPCAFCSNACRKWTQIFAESSDIVSKKESKGYTFPGSFETL